MLASNLEWFGGLVHTDFGFAAAWGAFPVLTAYVAQAEGLSAGANDYLAKPYADAELLARVPAWFSWDKAASALGEAYEAAAILPAG